MVPAAEGLRRFEDAQPTPSRSNANVLEDVVIELGQVLPLDRLLGERIGVLAEPE